MNEINNDKIDNSIPQIEDKFDSLLSEKLEEKHSERTRSSEQTFDVSEEIPNEADCVNSLGLSDTENGLVCSISENPSVATSSFIYDSLAFAHSGTSRVEGDRKIKRVEEELRHQSEEAMTLDLQDFHSKLKQNQIVIYTDVPTKNKSASSLDCRKRSSEPLSETSSKTFKSPLVPSSMPDLYRLNQGKLEYERFRFLVQFPFVTLFCMIALVGVLLDKLIGRICFKFASFSQYCHQNASNRNSPMKIIPSIHELNAQVFRTSGVWATLIGKEISRISLHMIEVWLAYWSTRNLSGIAAKMSSGIDHAFTHLRPNQKEEESVLRDKSMVMEMQSHRSDLNIAEEHPHLD